jgi:hypothetical protein
LLSSKLPANGRNGVFYGDAYNRHTLENAKTFIKSSSERDENGNFIHKTMGEKSRFYENPEILTMGCSFTEGGALPSMLNWSKIIEQKTKLKVNNCGYPGSGVAFQSGFAADVIRSFGAPNTIYYLIPNLDRAWLPHRLNEVDGLIDMRHIDWDQNVGAYIETRNQANPGERSSKEFEIHAGDNRNYQIPPELIVFYSFLIIDIFESLCAAANINFKFATWPQKEQKVLNNYVKYDSYIPVKNMPEINKSISPKLPYWRQIEAEQAARGFAPHPGPRLWEVLGLTDCNECEHEPQTEMQEHYWVYGSDGRHSGVHDHIHFAEHFTQQKITNDDLSGFLQ